MFANKLAEMATIKEVLTSAESLAHEMGDKEPGSEHLLLAAIDMQDGLARRAFEQIGADPDDFATAIVRQHEAALAAAGIEAAPKPPTHIPTNDKTPMSLGPSARSGVPARDQAGQGVSPGGVRQRARRDRREPSRSKARQRGPWPAWGSIAPDCGAAAMLRAAALAGEPHRPRLDLDLRVALGDTLGHRWSRARRCRRRRARGAPARSSYPRHLASDSGPAATSRPRSSSRCRNATCSPNAGVAEDRLAVGERRSRRVAQGEPLPDLGIDADRSGRPSRRTSRGRRPSRCRSCAPSPAGARSALPAGVDERHQGAVAVGRERHFEVGRVLGVGARVPAEPEARRRVPADDLGPDRRPAPKRSTSTSPSKATMASLP